MTSSGRFGAGFLLGALLAGLLVTLWPTSDANSTTVPPGPVSATTVPLIAAEPFVESGEVMIGSTALLARGLEVEDGIARLEYDLAGMGPTLLVHDDPEHPGDVMFVPEHWRLTTGAGAVIEATTGPRDSSVRFELPAATDTVSTVELIGWRVATPFGERIELPIEQGARGSFRSGEAVIETILNQRTSTIVQIDFDHSSDEWSNGLPRPLEPGWRVTGRQGGGIQLIWDGDGTPESVVLEDFGFSMRPQEGIVLVIDSGAGS